MTTQYMILDLPIVGVSLDPTWATKLNNAFTAVDGHRHISGEGQLIPTAGLNINTDLPFNGNDAVELRSSQMQSNAAVLPTSDVCALYVKTGDLYYNNLSGTPIQLTTGDSLDTGSLAIDVWSYKLLNGNYTINPLDNFVYFDVNTGAARTINLPQAAAVTAGRYFVFKDTSGSAASNNITVSPDGADTIDTVATSSVISTAFGSLTLVSDGISDWNVVNKLASTATATSFGTIKLAGDLAGTGSTATSPKVGHLTGVSALVGMNNNTALVGRNSLDTLDRNLIKIDGTNVVLVGDTATNTKVRGLAVNIDGYTTIDLTTTTGDLTLTSGTGKDINLTAGDDIALTANDAVTIFGQGVTQLISSAANVAISGQTNTAMTAQTGTATITGATGSSLHTGSTSVVLTTSLITLTSSNDVTLHSTGNNIVLTSDTDNILMTAVDTISGQVSHIIWEGDTDIVLSTPSLQLEQADTSTQVSATGGADALPAAPVGYLRIMINSTIRKIPYYAD